MELNKIFSKYFRPAILEYSKIDTKTCKECGGSCCKSMGCHISPGDLQNISVESIINLIDESQCVSIDYWVGNPITNKHEGRGYYLRMRNVDSHVIDPAYHGVCSILTPTGCPLPFTYRPKGARELVPCANSDCTTEYTKQQCAIDWMQYKDIMQQVYQHYHDIGDEKVNIVDMLICGLLGGLL